MFVLLKYNLVILHEIEQSSELSCVVNSCVSAEAADGLSSKFTKYTKIIVH